MRRFFSLVLCLVMAVFFSSSNATGPRYVGWSTGYYTSWSQGSYPPTKINWKAFTHICHFSCGPNSSGGISGLGGTASTNLIAEAHKNNVKVLLCVGGAGSGGSFAGAANPTNRSKFISNMIKFMTQYGYDGIDLDWEELSGADAYYVALHKEMRDSLNKMTPRPLFTVAMANYLATVDGQIWPYMDQMNSMTYWTQVSGLDGDFSGLLSKGIPKSVLGVGLGFATEDGEIDITPALCKAKVIYTLDKGYGGIMMWAIDKDASRNGGATPCLDTIAHYVNKTTGSFMAVNEVRYEKQVSLLIRNNAKGSVQEIRYSIPVASGPSYVDLGVFDIKGALVTTLVRGQGNPGTFSVPFAKQFGAGEYVVKLSTDSKVAAAKTFIVK
jgi:hypothetical protein